MKRVAVNDPAAIYMLAHFYYQGLGGLQQDRDKAIELFRRAAELGCSIAAGNLGGIYHEGGNLKKAKFYFEAAAIAGCEASRHELGDIEKDLGNVERAIQHLRIGASAGCYRAMHALQVGFEQGGVSRESIDSTLAAYNNSCAEIRSESRSAFIQHAIHLGN
jgi:TPR repeat protein